MAKLIKRDNRPFAADSVEGDEATGAAEGDLGQAAEAPARPGIIDRASYEARAEAVSIKDRAIAQAEEIVAEARAQAEAIVAEGQAELEQRRQSAHDEGLAKGREEGISKLLEATLQASERAQAVQAELTPQVVTLSMAIARRILGRELEFEPETVVQVVKQALSDKARQRREITLRINPADMPLIKEHRAQLLEVLSRTKEIAIQEDPDVARHGVIIETEAGIIDAQLEVQLVAMERALQAAGEEP